MNKNWYLALAVVLLIGGISALRAQHTEPMPTQDRFTFEYYDRNGNGVLDPEELSLLLFDRWDRSGSGYITAEEWHQVGPEWYSPLTNIHIHDFNHWASPVGAGQMSFESFHEMLSSRNVFQRWDRNGDYGVSRQELEEMFQRIEGQPSTYDERYYQWEMFLR